jgi:hypothetical protein
MGNTIRFSALLLTVLTLLIVPHSAQAATIAGSSAAMQVASISINSPDSKNIDYNLKKRVIRNILEKHNSPMVDSVDAYINTCKTYNIDCYLLPSISALESGYGQQTLSGSHNPFGWGGGTLMFKSWDECIETVGKSLRENYMDKGADTVDKIAPIYAESKTWAPRVNNFMNEFRAEEEKNQLFFSGDSVKL